MGDIHIPAGVQLPNDYNKNIATASDEQMQQLQISILMSMAKSSDFTAQGIAAIAGMLKQLKDDISRLLVSFEAMGVVEVSEDGSLRPVEPMTEAEPDSDVD